MCLIISSYGGCQWLVFASIDVGVSINPVAESHQIIDERCLVAREWEGVLGMK